MIIAIGTFLVGLFVCVFLGAWVGLITSKEDFWMGFVFSFIVPTLFGIYFIGKSIAQDLNLL